MTADNHWKSLKHEFLGYMKQPCLDHTVHIMVMKVIPSYLQKMDHFDPNHCEGCTQSLTPFQKSFKWEWKCLTQWPHSNWDYSTNIATWTCPCGSQALHSYHFCKHLVQAVESLSKPPPNFFTHIIQCHTLPLYHDPFLRNMTAPYISSISNSDNLSFARAKITRHIKCCKGPI